METNDDLFENQNRFKKSTEPSITIEHQHSCNKGLPQSCRQSDQGVFKEAVFDDIVLIVSFRLVNGVIPMLNFEWVMLELHWRGLQRIRFGKQREEGMLTGLLWNGSISQDHAETYIAFWAYSTAGGER